MLALQNDLPAISARVHPVQVSWRKGPATVMATLWWIVRFDRDEGSPLPLRHLSIPLRLPLGQVGPSDLPFPDVLYMLTGYDVVVRPEQPRAAFLASLIAVDDDLAHLLIVANIDLER